MIRETPSDKYMQKKLITDHNKKEKFNSSKAIENIDDNLKEITKEIYIKLENGKIV